MNTRNVSLLFSGFTLALAVLACSMNIGGPEYPTPAIMVSTEAVGELRSSVETAVAASVDSGQVMLSFTESQLTSFLNNKLQAQSNPLITNPQVYLRDGQLQVYGTARKSYFEATARIILSAGVDEQGQLKIELTSADFGPLPVPNGLKEIITATILETYTGALGPVASGIRLQSVTIADGTMTIVGNTK